MGQKSFNGYEHDKLWRNNGNGTFSEIGWVAGADLIQDSRCCVVGDFDRDGRMDLVVRTVYERTFLLRNEGPSGRFLRVRLVGRESNRMGVGARLEAYAQGDRFIGELSCGTGFLSQNEPGVHFGLGAHERVDRLVVRWPSGRTQEFTGLEADRFITLTEGEPTARIERPPSRPADQAAVQDRLLRTLREGTFLDPEGKPCGSSGLLKDVTLLHVWSPSCGSCSREASILREVQAFSSESFAVLAVAVDAEPAEVKAFIKEQGIDYPVLIATGETARMLRAEPQPWRSQYRAFGFLQVGDGGTSSLPWTGLLDRWGLVRQYRGPVKLFEAKLDLLNCLEAIRGASR